jgi:hypothetical protein
MTYEQDRRSPPADDGGIGALAQRLLLFLVAFVILHGFCLFVIAQVVRLDPAMVTGNPDTAAMLCGPGTTITTDFRTRAEGGSRSLDRWLVCRDSTGQVIEGAGQLAAWLSALVLSVPLGLIMLRWILRLGRSRRTLRAVHQPAGPLRWTERLALSGAALLVAAVVAAGTGAYLTQYQGEAIGRSELAGRYLCGEDRTVRLVDAYTRRRRFACFDPIGQEVAAPVPGTFPRLILPVFLAVALPGLLLVARLRNLRRTVHIRSRG